MRAPWEEDVLSEAGMDDDFVIKALPSPKPNPKPNPKP